MLENFTSTRKNFCLSLAGRGNVLTRVCLFVSKTAQDKSKTNAWNFHKISGMGRPYTTEDLIKFEKLTVAV